MGLRRFLGDERPSLGRIAAAINGIPAAHIKTPPPRGGGALRDVQKNQARSTFLVSVFGLSPVNVAFT